MNTPAERTHPHRRGALLTIAIIFVGLHGLLYTALTYGTIQAAGREQSPLYLTLLLLASLASVVAAVGLWLWKRWGWYLFLVAGLASAAIALLATGSIWMLFGSLLQTIIVAYIIFPHLKNFS